MWNKLKGLLFSNGEQQQMSQQQQKPQNELQKKLQMATHSLQKLINECLNQQGSLSQNQQENKIKKSGLLNSTLNNIKQKSKKQQIEQILLQYANKSVSKKLAQEFFIALQKDKIIINPLDQFFQVLKSKDLDYQTIKQIRYLINSSKKMKLKSYLYEKLGSFEGGNLFSKYQAHFPEKLRTPINSKDNYLGKQKGLMLYKYSQSQIPQMDKITAKNIIVLGETGCGKSTFLNSLANYLAGIQFEDRFRYKIIVENTSSQTKSITSQINIYYIKNDRNGDIYRVIDTPGFGDTKGIEKDQEIKTKVQNLFKNKIDSVHLVLFVTKSSVNRITQFQHYIFQRIMDLFSKQIAQNFLFVLTFSDASTPLVLQSIQDKKKGFGLFWDSIKQPKTISVNNSGFFQYNQQNQVMLRQFWNIGSLFLSKLIEKAQNTQAKCLSNTRDFIKKKETLAKRVKSTHNDINNLILNQENIRKQIMTLLQHQQQMKKNLQFKYSVEQDQWEVVTVPHNVTRCTVCVQTNCHQKCGIPDNEGKKDCSAMKDEKCTICPKNCHYTLHINDHYLKVPKTVTKIRTNTQMFKKYTKAKSAVQAYQLAINQIIDKYQKSIKSTQQSLIKMTELQKQLQKMSMSNSKPQSIKSYLNMLISIQSKQQKLGYLDRIKSYNTILQQIEYEQNLIKGKQFHSRVIRKIQLVERIYKELKAQKSETLDRILMKLKKQANQQRNDINQSSSSKNKYVPNFRRDNRKQ